MPVLIVSLDREREDLQRYVERGGYLGLARAVKEGAPAVLAALRDGGLRGRGGSGRGELTAVKWEQVAQARNDQKFVIANGAESNPQSRKDHLLLTRYPHRVLEGLLIACYTVGARQAFVYIKETYADAIRGMQQAIAEAVAEGAWGPIDVSVMVYEAPDVPVAGEESAALDAIEGFPRPRPRLRPPEITKIGLYGHPTVVNNVETLAAAAAVMRTGKPADTVLITLSGDVNDPGVYEIPLGTPLDTVLERWGGGVQGPVRAVFPGGITSGPLRPEELGFPLDYDVLQRAGTTIGLGVLHVVARDGWEPAAALAEAAAQWAENSCGQCHLCQDGTIRLREAAKSSAGGGKPDAEEMELWALRMRDKGNCLYATMAARAATRWLRAFGPELSITP